ncbi:MAG TPA: COX15/CtaA family protein [Steroidobacteraceae bacterium]|nr:COX15/CtaA family protein [Steroidobacteraceae bacterium]
MAELAQQHSVSTLPLLRKVALAAVLLGFVVVVLGAYVRLTAAGLGCPDWPGCYGHLSPLGAQHSAAAGTLLSGARLDVGKAWHEMIHRYAAGTLVLLVALIAAISWASRPAPAHPGYALALLATIVVQAGLGMLTVTWQLKPLIVTLHLLFGLTTLSLLWWLWLSLRLSGATERTQAASSAARANGASAGLPMAEPAASVRTWRRARALATLALGVLAVQIALGGWTSSNYAAIACPDFPTCQGSWWPAMDRSSAFVLWRAPSIDYEGGVLSNRARVAIHFTHRLGALGATCALLLAALYTLRSRRLRVARLPAAAVLAALALQLTIAISMVLRGFPLWLATAHNAGAALALLAVLALLHALRHTPREAIASQDSAGARSYKSSAAAAS